MQVTCGRSRRGPSGGSPPRRDPWGGRLRGPAAHGRGGGRGWLLAPALPWPGRRGRSVGTARRAHLAGSHPSARRGARWERGAGAARRPGRADPAGGRGAGAAAASASRPSRASGASYSGDEEPSGHPAQIAAAAGRLHCLTITRAGFSPRILRLLLPFSHCGPCLFLWNVLGVLTSVTVTCKSKRPISGRESSFLKITEGDCQSNSRAGRLTRRTDTPGPAVLASGEAPV